MRLGHFDMNLLLALDALLDTRSVTSASERLYMGQSAMSSALGRLREHFGDELLVKVGRGLELTPYGQSLIEPVRQALVGVRQAITVRKDFDPLTAERRFVIRATDYLATTVLTDVMRRLQTEAPNISLTVADLTGDLSELLNRGEIDLVLAIEGFMISNHPREHLFDDQSVAIADNRNDQVSGKLTMEQFRNMNHVVVSLGTPQTKHHEAWLLSDQSLKRRINVTVSRFDTLPQFIINTNRIGLTHRVHAEWWQQYLPLKILEIPFHIPTQSVFMQWNKNMDADPGHVWLRKYIKNSLGRDAMEAQPNTLRT